MRLARARPVGSQCEKSLVSHFAFFTTSSSNLISPPVRLAPSFFAVTSTAICKLTLDGALDEHDAFQGKPSRSTCRGCRGECHVLRV